MPPKPAPAPTAKGAWLGFALTLVAAWEGLYTHTYRDSVGVPTICYGVTAVDRPVHMGDTATSDQCKKWLAEDLPRYDAQVQKCIHTPLPPHRHAAIVSFTYNVGGGALCKSSVARYLNQGDPRRACDALMAYDKGRIHGTLTVIRGLHNRRVQEREWCLRDD